MAQFLRPDSDVAQTGTWISIPVTQTTYRFKNTEKIFNLTAFRGGNF